MDEVVTSEREAGDRFLVNSLMEEAIRSSQLEGATTSRMASQGAAAQRPGAKDRGERMIANNYRALQFMREEMGDDADPRSRSSNCTASSPRGRSAIRPPPAACRCRRSSGCAVFDRDDGQGRSTCRLPPSCCRSACGCSATSPTQTTTARLRPSRAAGDPLALLARLRPPVRGWQRANRPDPLLLGDARAGLLAGRVPADLTADPQGSGPVRAGVHGNRDRRWRHHLLPPQSAEVIERAIDGSAPVSPAQDAEKRDIE